MASPVHDLAKLLRRNPGIAGAFLLFVLGIIVPLFLGVRVPPENRVIRANGEVLNLSLKYRQSESRTPFYAILFKPDRADTVTLTKTIERKLGDPPIVDPSVTMGSLLRGRYQLSYYYVFCLWCWKNWKTPILYEARIGDLIIVNAGNREMMLADVRFENQVTVLIAFWAAALLVLAGSRAVFTGGDGAA